MIRFLGARPVFCRGERRRSDARREGQRAQKLFENMKHLQVSLEPPLPAPGPSTLLLSLCESFFATLECELLDRRRFKTRAEAKMAIFDFIEGFYNPHRRHSSLGQQSPANFERRHSTAA
jgi:transposase InsO family protein